jgi:hypothetical protein
MSEDSQRKTLPFEPRRKRNKAAKPVAPVVTPESRQAASLSAIPDVVSRRMIRRMALFCGVPSGLGVASFFIFYWVVSHDWFEIPPYAVFAATLGLFGLGVVGLSYGILSTSWDENRVGGWFGWQEFTLNAKRLFEAWREARRSTRSAKNPDPS